MIALIRKVASSDAIIGIALWILIVAVLGLVDFVDFSFRWSRILTPGYIAETLTVVSLGILVFARKLNKDYRKFKENDETTRELEQTTTKTYIDNPSDDLPLFVLQENIERRKETYRAKKEAEFQNLLSKLAKWHPDSLAIWANGALKDEEKAEDKYCKKLLSIKRVMDKEYIEANASVLPASFKKITPNFMTSGVSTRTVQSNLDAPSQPFVQAVKDNWLAFTLPMMVGLFILSLVMDYVAHDNYVVFLKIGIKMLLLMSQIFNAQAYSPKFYKLTFVADTHLRYRLSCKYLSWKIKRKGGGPDAIQKRPDREIRSADKQES